MNEQVMRCVEYFRSRPGFRRVLEELRKKYASYGKAAGTLRLADASPEEREALKGLFGRTFSGEIRIRAVDFEDALRHSSLGDVSLREVLEQYFNADIKTKKEVKEARDTRFSQMLQMAREKVRSARCLAWLDTLEERGNPGGTMLRREAKRDGGEAARQLLLACRGLERLETLTVTPVRLAVLSALATTDPHALDSTGLGGRLFLQLLAFRSGAAVPSNAEQRDSLYFENGILCDSISSLVTQTGLVMGVGDAEHPAYRALRERREICTLSLAGLAGIDWVRSPSGRVYIVENEMVFTQLCDLAADFRSPLICTSGQPSVAALRLLDMLAREGTIIFYSGDFDGKGLSIASQLYGRYPDLLRPWHMTEADFGLCRSQVELSQASRSLLRGCAGTPLEPVAEEVSRRGLVGYQELLIPLLGKDLTKTP